MSDHEHDDADVPEQPQEQPLAPDEIEAEEEAEAAEQAPEEPAEEPPTESASGMTEKQMEASRKKLDAENTRHANRISEIIGEEAQLLVPCALCSGFADGFRFPVLPPPDVIEATRVAIGLPDLSNYQQAKTAHKCPDCEGLGVVLSGSLVPENAAIRCETCNQTGYVVVQEATGELVAPPPLNGGTQQALPAGVNEDDPAVKSLRARGYSVFPPMQVTAGT